MLYLSYASDSQYLLSLFPYYVYMLCTTCKVKFLVYANLLGNKFDSDSDLSIYLSIYLSRDGLGMKIGRGCFESDQSASPFNTGLLQHVNFFFKARDDHACMLVHVSPHWVYKETKRATSHTAM